jgi:hypothetical protein
MARENLWRFCYDHSLTIVLAIFALAAWVVGFTIEDEFWQGFVTDLGHDAFSGVIIFALSAWLYERNRPEKPPK